MHSINTRLDVFFDHFRVELAYSQRQLNDAYALRYAVYCKEHGWENPQSYPAQKERDQFDSASMHVLIRHVSTGWLAGYARIIMPDRLEVDQRLPFEYCHESLLSQSRMLGMLDCRTAMCEISRFTVDARFRERQKPIAACLPIWLETTESERKCFKMLSTVTALAVAALLLNIDRPHGFAIMTPVLPKLFNKIGIPFSRVSADFEHRGKRAVYHLDTTRLSSSIKPPYLASLEYLRSALMTQPATKARPKPTRESHNTEPKLGKTLKAPA